MQRATTKTGAMDETVVEMTKEQWVESRRKRKSVERKFSVKRSVFGDR